MTDSQKGSAVEAPLSPSGAVEDMRECARWLVAPELAEEWLQPCGLTLADLGIRPRKATEFHRAVPLDDEPAVATESVSVKLALRVVPGFADPGFPYHGRGKNAEHRTFVACDALAGWIAQGGADADPAS